jgi:hypothetical protein
MNFYYLLIKNAEPERRTLNAGESLSIGQTLTQSDGSYFIFQDGGNLQYVSSSGSVLWETGSTGGTSFSLDSNGVLGIYDENGSSRWSFNGQAGSVFTIQDSRPVLQNGGSFVTIPASKLKHDLI